MKKYNSVQEIQFLLCLGEAFSTYVSYPSLPGMIKPHCMHASHMWQELYQFPFLQKPETASRRLESPIQISNLSRK